MAEFGKEEDYAEDQDETTMDNDNMPVAAEGGPAGVPGNTWTKNLHCMIWISITIRTLFPAGN